MSSDIDTDLNSFFDVRRVDKSMREVVPRRAAPVRPLPGVSNEDTQWMKIHAYERAGIMGYDDCWTGEMASRPIPFISTDVKPKIAQQFVYKHLPALLTFLAPRMVAHIQPFNKISRLGYPVCANPGTGIDPFTGLQTHASKLDLIYYFFGMLQAGDWSAFGEAFLTIGKRLQTELPNSNRIFQFITSQGKIVERKITAEDRQITVPKLGTMIGSRTRTIVQGPVTNLYLQCVDSMIHNAIMMFDLCDSNMYAHTKWPHDMRMRTFDCKHYERYLGMAALAYADCIGGTYGMRLNELIHMPFIVPSDDWRTFWEIQPHYREGVYPQFSSGLSPVAPLGKVTNICAQIEYFTTHHSMGQRDAIALVMSGQSPGLLRRMYGDDNLIMGDEAEMATFIKFMSEVFEIEEDEHPKYLGMTYVPQTEEFMLPAQTYDLKMYQPERDYSWRDYPYLGLVERRKIFQRYGEPVIGRELIPYEDQLWAAIDDPYQRIISAAVAESQEANRAGIQLTKWQVTDKDYLMTPSEQMSSGRFWHLDSPVVATIILSLVGEKLKGELNFRGAPFTAVPEPTKLTRRITYDKSYRAENAEALEEEASA